MADQPRGRENVEYLAGYLIDRATNQQRMLMGQVWELAYMRGAYENEADMEPMDNPFLTRRLPEPEASAGEGGAG